MKNITGWYPAEVIAEYPCQWGRGAMLKIDGNKKVPAGAGQLPKDFKIGDKFKAFISFGVLVEAVVTSFPIGFIPCDICRKDFDVEKTKFCGTTDQGTVYCSKKCEAVIKEASL